VAAEKKRQEQACVKAEKAAENAHAAEARKTAQDYKKAEKLAQLGKRKASSITKPKAKRQKQSGGGHLVSRKSATYKCLGAQQACLPPHKKLCHIAFESCKSIVRL
jgi:hypothetical protein